jgi:hypothetical protein
MPVGLQLYGRAFDEATVLSFAHAYEQTTDWHRRRPTLAALHAEMTGAFTSAARQNRSLAPSITRRG